MELNEEKFYHIYNRGNNSQPIFFTKENYIFFLKKMHTHINPKIRLLAYCLMPTHFHWLVYVRKQNNSTNKSPSLNKDIGILLRSYTQAINKQFGRTGSLFQQRTKAKQIKSQSYVETCFHYIHQNPLRANLVNKIGDWPFSSFPNYADKRTGSLVDKEFAIDHLNVTQSSFIKESMQAIDPKKIKNIY
ncbi:MAG: transposase [Bacteroidota bacterium]